MECILETNKENNIKKIINTCLFFWLELEECLLWAERSMGAGLAEGEEWRLLPYTELASSSSSIRTLFIVTVERVRK